MTRPGTPLHFYDRRPLRVVLNAEPIDREMVTEEGRRYTSRCLLLSLACGHRVTAKQVPKRARCNVCLAKPLEVEA